MRKIYPFLPLPFNKFAIFVLYGLSIALITLAQNKNDGIKSGCNLNPLEPFSQEKKQVIIGYVQLFFTSQPMDPDKIPWDRYDYINVIAYPGEGEQYSVFRPRDGINKLKPIIDNLVKARNKSKTKILLSLRNYQVGVWPKSNEFDNNDDLYDRIVNETKDTLDKWKLDGIDIEYPGMRGKLCSGWNEFDESSFYQFLMNLRDAIEDKTLMLTVGIEPIGYDLRGIGLDFLNIETYHYSLYYNSKPGNNINNEISSYPNNPYNIFTSVFSNWNGSIEREKIIMSIDFGNTVQGVNTKGEDISKSQTFSYPSSATLDPIIMNEIIPPVTPIRSYCTNGNSVLYSWPWNNFTKFFKFPCADTTNFFSTGNWTRGFEDVSKTPWIYTNYSSIPNAFIYVSYEDVVSLRSKLEFVMENSIGGMSISDVSYDDDNNTLLEYMQVIRGKQPNIRNGPNPDSTTPTKEGNGKSDSEKSDPASSDESNKTGKENQEKPKKKSIVGAIVGPIVSIFVVALVGFFVYKYRRQPRGHPKPEAGDFIPKGGPLQTHASLKNELPSEPTSRLVPNTAVIPIASGHVTAMFDFVGKEETDLSFKKGDIIEVLEKGDGPNDWWVGRVNGVVGEFPGNYVKET